VTKKIGKRELMNMSRKLGILVSTSLILLKDMAKEKEKDKWALL